MEADTHTPEPNFKEQIKEWLRINRYSYRWLATQVGLAEGTVRNWFYTASPITEENQRKINEAIQREEGSCLNLYTGAFVDFHKLENYECFDLLAAIANVPSSSFRHEPLLVAGHYGTEKNSAWQAAEWLTSEINKIAVEEIQEHIGTLKRDGKKFNPITAPKATLKLETIPEQAGGNIFYIKEDDFNTFFAKIAAKIKGYETVEEWINAAIDKIALSAFEASFEVGYGKLNPS